MGKKIISNRLPEPMITNIDRVAQETNRNRTEAMEYLIQDGLQIYEKKKSAKLFSVALIMLSVAYFALQMAGMYPV